MLTSLVLHALLLFALPMLKEAKRQIPARLTARLAAPEKPEAVPQKLEPLPPQPRTAPQPPAFRPDPTATAPPQPAPVAPSVAAPLPSVEPRQAGEPAFTVPASPPAASAPASRAEPQPAVAAGSGRDPGTVARFRLELMDVARRYKKYPRIAQDNNWEGRVELRIAIGEDGAISSLTVKKGSGRAVLDDEAQAMIRTAKSKATIPPVLRGRAFILEIPVDFFLKDEER